MTEQSKPDGKRTAMPQDQRAALADLYGRLAKLACPHCNTMGFWRIDNSAENVRYIRCGGCNRYAKVVTDTPPPGPSEERVPM